MGLNPLEGWPRTKKQKLRISGLSMKTLEIQFSVWEVVISHTWIVLSSNLPLVSLCHLLWGMLCSVFLTIALALAPRSFFLLQTET
jgi:hypothetical protein